MAERYDQASASARAPMRRLAPAMIGTSRSGLEMSARLVAMCVSTALASPNPGRIAADERRRLVNAADTAQYLLDRCGGAPIRDGAVRVATLRGTTKWWVRGLDLVGMTEPFYRRIVAPEAAAEAVMVVSRASGAAMDRRLWQTLRWCVVLTSPSREGAQGSAPRRGGQLERSAVRRTTSYGMQSTKTWHPEPSQSAGPIQGR